MKQRTFSSQIINQNKQNGEWNRSSIYSFFTFLINHIYVTFNQFSWMISIKQDGGGGSGGRSSNGNRFPIGKSLYNILFCISCLQKYLSLSRFVADESRHLARGKINSLVDHPYNSCHGIETFLTPRSSFSRGTGNLTDLHFFFLVRSASLRIATFLTMAGRSFCDWSGSWERERERKKKQSRENEKFRRWRVIERGSEANKERKIHPFDLETSRRWMKSTLRP